MPQTRDLQSALSIFREHNGVLRTAEALARGIHPEALYRLREDGKIVQLARGLYRLASAREFTNPDLAVVFARAPNAVVCLVSALALHEITTQIPRTVSIAVPRGGYYRLRLRAPPVQVFRFDSATFEEGIESRRLDGATIRVYGAARTIVDCFKYRNKLGLDIAVEALRNARQRKRIGNKELLHFARVLRQEKVMAPYLDAMS